MEQSCYKCGQTVEEGVAFCPHCAAPQIRVVVAEPAPMPSPLVAAGEGSAVLPQAQTVPVLAIPMEWSKAVIPSALGALVGFLLMSLGLYFFVAALVAGFLAAIFYRQRHATGMRTSTGARLGALSGLFCSALTALVGAVGATIPDLRAKMREQITEDVQRWAAAHPDLRVQAALDQLKTPEGFVSVMIAGGIVLVVLSVVLGTCGGALGGAIQSRHDKP